MTQESFPAQRQYERCKEQHAPTYSLASLLGTPRLAFGLYQSQKSVSYQVYPKCTILSFCHQIQRELLRSTATATVPTAGPASGLFIDMAERLQAPHHHTLAQSKWSQSERKDSEEREIMEEEGGGGKRGGGDDGGRSATDSFLAWAFRD